MIQFRSKVDDGVIRPEIDLAQYLGQLYTSQELRLERIVRTESREEDYITEAELEVSRAKLSRHKAVGVDLLRDMTFHDDAHWNRIKDKILRKFNEWISTLRIPRYLKTARIIPISKDPNNSPFPELG